MASPPIYAGKGQFVCMTPAKPPSCLIFTLTRSVLGDSTRLSTSAGFSRAVAQSSLQTPKRHGHPYLRLTFLSRGPPLPEGPPPARLQAMSVIAAESSRETKAWRLEGNPSGKPGTTSAIFGACAVKLVTPGVPRTPELVVPVMERPGFPGRSCRVS